jgi:ectoine hydrolase
MSAFEQTEYRERVQRVSAAMHERGVDTLVILAEANIFYLTGYEGFSDYVPQAAVLRAGDQDATLILREMDLHCAYPTVYLGQAKIECYPENLIGTPERSPWEVIGARVKEIAQGGTIGVEYRASVFSYRDHLALAAVLDDQSVVDGSGLVETSKKKKSTAELGYMRKAATIVDNALQKGIAQIGEGVRECDVAATILHQLTAGTAECGGGPTKPPTMGVGARAAAPHLKWTDSPYVAGSQTDFEIGGYVHRYACPLSRTAYLGEPPQRLLDVHDAVVDGFLAAEAAIRPGGTCGDIHRAFAGAFYPHGVRKESRIGYSVGIDWSDLCFSLQDDDETILEVDYTFHLIIGVWEKTDAYVFSEAFRVGPNGGESFSKTPRKLFVQ